MRCADVEFKLLELIEGELPPGQRSEVLSHLDGCAVCTAEFATYRNLLTRVEIDPVPEPSPSFWDEFLPALKSRIRQEGERPELTPVRWLAGVRSWCTFRPRLVAGLAVAAVSIFIVVRLPSVLPRVADRRTVPVTIERAAGQHGERDNTSAVSRLDDRNHQPGEPLMVAGEVVEDPAVLVAAIQRLGWANEIADRLEAAWVLRPEADPTDSLAALDEKERQFLLNRLNQLQWSES